MGASYDYGSTYQYAYVVISDGMPHMWVCAGMGAYGCMHLYVCSKFGVCARVCVYMCIYVDVRIHACRLHIPVQLMMLCSLKSTIVLDETLGSYCVYERLHTYIKKLQLRT